WCTSEKAVEFSTLLEDVASNRFWIRVMTYVKAILMKATDKANRMLDSKDQ
ncbi:hypothetical protein Tco_1224628, partial [Tanacetum coccineum]